MLFGTILTAQHFVAMREATILDDNITMRLGKFDVILIAQSGEQAERAGLILQILTMHERHVEKRSLVFTQPVIQFAVNGLPRNLQRQMVGRKGICTVTKNIARNLVKQK